MSTETTVRWRAYVERRGYTPWQVLLELLRDWPATEHHVPSRDGLMRPCKAADVDAMQDHLRDEIVAACDRLDVERRTRP